jgi:hypothetical protein
VRGTTLGGERRRRLQAVIFVLTLVLLNAPALVVVDRAGLAAGLPLTPAYLFLVWLAAIAACALNTRRSDP